MLTTLFIFYNIVTYLIAFGIVTRWDEYGDHNIRDVFFIMFSAITVPFYLGTLVGKLTK